MRTSMQACAAYGNRVIWVAAVVCVLPLHQCASLSLLRGLFAAHAAGAIVPTHRAVARCELACSERVTCVVRTPPRLPRRC